MNIWDWGREQTMKIGICDDRYEIRHKVKEILQETYTEEQGFLIHSYTPNEIKIDIEDMVFDCEILIMNTDYPESGLRVFGNNVVLNSGEKVWHILILCV